MDSELAKILQNQFANLADIISRGVPEDDFEKIYYILRSYSIYLKGYDLWVNVEVELLLPVCVNCQRSISKEDEDEAIVLNCNDIICNQDCFRNLVISCTAHNIEEYIYTFCPKCNVMVDKDVIEGGFGKEDLNNLIEAEEEKRAPRFDCLMCYNLFRIDQSITLSCNHRFCEKCITEFVKMNLDEANMNPNESGCPICKESISINIRKSVLNKEEFWKLENILFESYIPEIGVGPVHFRCINEGCEFSAIVDKSIKRIKCETCGIIYCPLCRSKEHPNITCEQNYDLKTDKSLLELAGQQGWKQCPHCKNMCERISGCNFMKCMSVECKGVKSFCYLCGKGIAGYTHFKVAGPFGDVCNTMDGNKD